jgi:hypothetical protein
MESHESKQETVAAHRLISVLCHGKGEHCNNTCTQTTPFRAGISDDDIEGSGFGYNRGRCAPVGLAARGVNGFSVG